VGPAPHDAPPSDAAVQQMGPVEAVAALREHVADARVAEKACWRLWILSLVDGNEQADAEEGAIEAVVEALRAHPQVTGVQVHGCLALDNMCQGNDAARWARKQRAADAGAIEAVVEAMRAHPQVAHVQQCGCTALGNVCPGGDEEEALARWRRASQAGGRAATAAAMRAHPSNTELQRLGQRLLGQLPE
jgi:hypothetical protein